MSRFFPFPPFQAFERLQIADGLLMTAQRWKSAHDYHRQRQNFHHQSLHQPGVVCGLGVSVIPAPMDVAAQYRDGRWLQVQPGIAIDLLGNPIIVPQPEPFRIQSEPPPGQSLVVYLVVSYVDPDQLRQSVGRESVQERFRIVEKTNPSELDVELCRIHLQSGEVRLQTPTDVFFPGVNELDLRYRQPVCSRPLGIVQVAQVTLGTQQDNQISSTLSQLLQAVAVLYPTLQGETEIGQITPQFLANADLSNYDLLYLPRQHLLSFEQPVINTLGQYLERGGVLLIVVDFEEVNLDELLAVKQELQVALDNLGDEAELIAMRRELEAEISAIDTNITQHIQEVCYSINAIAERMGYPLEGVGSLNHQHPLRLHPFLFAQFPLINRQPLHLFNWGGIILMVGNLAQCWGLDEALTLPRETIRTAQEMGINLLHFAWHRHQLSQLQQASPFTTTASEHTQTLIEQVPVVE